MRRTALLLFAPTLVGCAHVSAGLWSDSDRGQTSVAAIASIELPAEPAPLRDAKPAVGKTASDPAKDEWDAPPHAAAVPAKIPTAEKAISVPLGPPPKSMPDADEAWGPMAKGISKTAEFGSEPDAYRWLQGRVNYVKIAGDRVWKIRFAPYDQVDKFGGSFVLHGALPADLKDGDLVRVEGFPASDQADSRSARYNCSRVTVLKRAGEK